jgi:S-formylglutathione hydrolase FrmB
LAGLLALALLVPATLALGSGAESDVDPAAFTSPEILRRYGAQPGHLIERRLASPALGRPVPYWVALPPGFDPARRYPVVYLLHGMAGHPGELLNYGFLHEARRQMAEGQVPPFLMVMPHGEQGYWMNQFGGPRWGDCITSDLVNEVDRSLPTIADRRQRAIAGVSMGGHGALQLAINRNDLFGVVGAHAPALRPRDRGFAFFGDEAHYRTIDPVSLASRPGPHALAASRLFIDIGEQDPWASRARTLHQILSERRVDHQFSVRPGGHDAAYWSSNVGDYVRFYGDAFQR